MRAGADRLLRVVVNTLGEAHAHHGYLFANARASRLKLPVHDGFGVWCATRRMHAGRFVWHTPEAGSATPALQLSTQQSEALTLACLGRTRWPPSAPADRVVDGLPAVDITSANGGAVTCAAPCCACQVLLPTQSI